MRSVRLGRRCEIFVFETPSRAPSDPGFLQGRLDRETDLIIQRTAWVVGSQAFLFTAYAVSLNGPAHGASHQAEAQSRLLMLVIPWVSLISLALLLVTIGAGVMAWVRLRLHARRSDPATPTLEGGPVVPLAGLAAPLFIPVAFLVTWVVLLLNR
jgi:hypothetical protein